jgi:uncharacterized protein (TIGR03437 family)
LPLVILGIPAFCQPAERNLFLPNRYTVLLQDPPVAAQFASREEMRGAAAVAYRQQVETRQANVVRDLRSRNIQVTGSVSLLINAVFVNATPDRLAEISAIPGVAAIRPMRRFKPVMNKATQLMNAPAAWNRLGGQGSAGAGIKIAILDSGIDQNHPAFQDPSLTIPAGFPKCTNGHPEDCNYTNNKVIVARSYVRMISQEYVTDPANPAAQSIPDDYAPRDRFGHGTAVASAAAGNINSGTVTFSGMAPKAYLGNYKITGSPGVNDGAADDVLIQAIHDALADGMDIASLSYGSIALTGGADTGSVCGNPTGVACDPVAAAFEAAAKAGLVVVVAGGNEGNTAYFNGGQYPYFGSISSPSSAPSVIAVGAMTNSHVLTPAVYMNASGAPAGLSAEVGDSFFYPSENGANTAPLVDVTTLGDDGTACNALPSGSLDNSIALIIRGTCPFAQKATNAADAGALGVIFYMADGSAPFGPIGMDCFSGAGQCFVGPIVMISNSDGLNLKKYIGANAGTSVTIDLAGAETDLATYVSTNGLNPAGSNQMASYSSLGPAPDGTIKPDILAVGGFDQQLASGIPAGLYLATQTFDPTLDSGLTTLYSSNGYLAADGTSFSAPIVAGAAALVKQAHPKYTVAQIKSALVNTAAQDVSVDDTGIPVDVEWIGAGRLDAGAAAGSTITAEPATVSFGFVKATMPSAKPISITNQGTSQVTLAVAVAPNTQPTGVKIAVDQQSLSLAPGAAATLNLSLFGSVPPPGSYSGFVTLQASGSSAPSARIPYLFIVGDGVPYNANPISGFAFGGPGADGGTLIVQVVDQYGAPVSGSAVNFSVTPRGGVTFQTVNGQSGVLPEVGKRVPPTCSPTSSTSAVTCKTDNYGMAYVEAILGSTSGSPSITARAAGIPFGLGATVINLPQLQSSGGVVNMATYAGPIAPGSYIALLGSNLVDPNALGNPNGDYAPTIGSPICPPTVCLPLTVDFVTVSFDVPSAGISLPGYVLFVSPTEVDVQAPWELQGQTSVQVKVIVDGLPGNVVTGQIASYTPAFFADTNSIVTAYDNTTKADVSSTAAVHAGDSVSLYANGLGPVNNQPASGFPAQSSPASTTTTLPVVTIGGKQAQVSYSGLAEGDPAEYQIDVVIPSGLSSGNQQVTIAIGGVTSPAVKLPVQ